MKIIENEILPPKGFLAINLFGILFCRNKDRINEYVLNHESIHTAQMKEMGYIPFYIWYVAEWALKLIGEGNAYRNISFEREAYDNQNNLDYLKNRKHYSWFKRLFK